jgi:transcriptional regulator with XRE-family HTH domain
MTIKPDIHPVDRHVGQQVRKLRRASGITQASLAVALGLSFQQVQKYETGANRISGSVLVAIVQALYIPIEQLFDGLPGLSGPTAVDAEPVGLRGPFAPQAHAELLADLDRLPDTLGQHIVMLVRKLAQQAEHAPIEAPMRPLDARRRRRRRSA